MHFHGICSFLPSIISIVYNSYKRISLSNLYTFSVIRCSVRSACRAISYRFQLSLFFLLHSRPSAHWRRASDSIPTLCNSWNDAIQSVEFSKLTPQNSKGASQDYTLQRAQSLFIYQHAEQPFSCHDCDVIRSLQFFSQLMHGHSVQKNLAHLYQLMRLASRSKQGPLFSAIDPV